MGMRINGTNTKCSLKTTISSLSQIRIIARYFVINSDLRHRIYSCFGQTFTVSDDVDDESSFEHQAKFTSYMFFTAGNSMQ